MRFGAELELRLAGAVPPRLVPLPAGLTAPLVPLFKCKPVLILRAVPQSAVRELIELRAQLGGVLRPPTAEARQPAKCGVIVRERARMVMTIWCRMPPPIRCKPRVAK